MEMLVEIRPFLNHPSVAYELVLIRREGDCVYDRSLCILSGTDAGDLCKCCPGIKFIRHDRPVFA